MARKALKQVLPQLLKRIDLAKYDQVRSFKSKDWYLQLDKRRHYLESIRPSSYEGEPSSLTILLNDPLDSRGYGSELLGRRSVVSDLQLVDVWREKNKIEATVPELAEELDKKFSPFELKSRPDYDLPVEFRVPSSLYMERNYFDEIFGVPNLMELQPGIRVDLRATDKQLRSTFDDWLRVKRNEQSRLRIAKPREKPFAEKDFEKWARLRVLPYLDIKIALHMMGLQATQRLIGDVLYFDEDVDTTEKVRKTLEPLVQSILLEATVTNFGL